MGMSWVCAGLRLSSGVLHHFPHYPTDRLGLSGEVKPLFWSSLGGQFVLVISPMSLPSKTWVKGQQQCPFNIDMGFENPSLGPCAATL